MERIIITQDAEFVFVSKITYIEIIFDKEQNLYQLIANFSDHDYTCLFNSEDIDLITKKQQDLYAFLISNMCYFSFSDILFKE